MTQPSETLLGLVERYSPTGQEREAVEWLVGRMRGLGFSSARADEAGNAVGVMGDGPNQIVLLGHIDTVPGRIDVRIEDGILHGRGSVDAKGPLAAFVDAAAKTGAIPGWQVVVIGAVDEEGDSAGARQAVGCWHPRFAVIGEPSGWDRITLGYRGILRFRFAARQAVGHTAAGQESACEAAVGFWNRLAEIGARENAGAERKFDQLTAVLERMASSGDGFTQTAEIGGHLRLPLSIAPEQAERLLREAAEGAGALDLEGIPLSAYRVEKNTPVVGALLAAIRSLGGDPSFSLKLGTADFNIAGPQWNCPMAVYGPGDSALDHTPEERLSLEEFERSVSVLEAVLKRLAFANALK
ncbi:MAG: [LysW]-lysine hydrolase [Anaerolineales bacterium]|nr:[LysW]-lysine hydrolase [Anaerolineales bacterium]